MNTVGVDAQALQALDQLINTHTGLGEYQHLTPVLLFQQVDKQFGLAFFVYRHHPLLDRARRDVARADFDGQWVIEHLPGQLADGVGEGRGEQQGLTTLGQGSIDVTQLFGETEVEHTVSFIENQDLQLIELQRFLPIEIQQATWGCHQYIDPAAQLHHLRIDADAAVHRVSFQRQVFVVLLNVFMNLLRQFAGRHQHQRAH